MITLKSTCCRLLDDNNRGVSFYKVITKVTDGVTIASFQRYRLIPSWSDLTDKQRRKHFREEVNDELFEVLNNYENIQENWEKIQEDMKESIHRSHQNFEAYHKCINSVHGFWELYDF